MRRCWICWIALAMLAAGCAANRGADPEMAPSRLAAAQQPTPALADAGRQPAPALADAGRQSNGEVGDSSRGGGPTASAHEAARQPDASRNGQEPPSGAIEPEAGVTPTDRDVAINEATMEMEEAGTRGEPRPQRRVRPIVPAFPVRVGQLRIESLKTVFFDFDKWELSAEARATLEGNGRWLRANPEVMVQIGGHADDRGTSEYNLALGERRAKQVHDYLVGLGVSPHNLRTVSFGEEMPLDDGHDAKAWQANRRAEFSQAESATVSGLDTTTDPG